MKKKIIIISSIILLVLVCFISTIYALWYISENKIIKPSELTKKVVESYIKKAANETYTYGGGTSLNNAPSPQLPLSSKLDNNELIYYYKLETEETWVTAEKNGNVVTKGPLVVGTYDIYVTYDKITKNDEGNEVKETVKIENIKFEISQYTIDVSSLTQTNDLVYTKQAQTPEYSNFSDLIYFNDEVELTVSSYNDCINAGTYSVDLSISGADSANYQLSSSRKEFTIAKAQISLVWTNLEQIYDKTNKEVRATAKGFVEGDESLLSISYADAERINVGSYSATAFLTDETNYEITDGTITATLVIKPITITDLIWNVPTGLTYTGSDLASKVSVTSNQIINGDTVTFRLSFSDYEDGGSSSGTYECINAGKYTVNAQVSNNSNYVLDKSINKYEYLDIGKADLQINLTYGDTNVTITNGGTGLLHRQYYVMNQEDQLKINYSFEIVVNDGSNISLPITTDVVKVTRTRYQTDDTFLSSPTNITTYGSFTDTFSVSNDNFNSYSYSQSYDIYIARLTSDYRLVYDTANFTGAYTSVDVAIYDSNNGASGSYIFVYGDCIIGEVSSNLTIKSDVELFLPHNGTVGYQLYTKDTGLDLTDVGHTNVGDRNNLSLVEYLSVEIKSGTNITLYGRITVGADRGQSSSNTGGSGRIEADTRTGYSTINLNSNSKIIAESGSEIWCLGYIEGSGSIIAQEGANIYEPFVITDWRGGSMAGPLYVGSFGDGTSIPALDALAGNFTGGKSETENAVPFNQYEMHHIAVSTTINYGANLIGLAAIYTSAISYSIISIPARWNTTTYNVIGSGALLELLSGSHIVKTYDYNEDKTTFEIYGTVNDNPGTLSIVLFNESNPLELSTENLFFGLNHNIKINVKDGSTLNVGYKYKMLPGSKVIIDDGGTLNLSGSLIIYTENPGNSYPTNVEDASLVINGTMNVAGRFAGYSSSDSQGVLNLSSASSLELTSNELTGSMVVDTGVIYLDAKIIFTTKLLADNQSHHLYSYNSDGSYLTKKTYVWDIETFSWVEASNLNSFTINFHIEGEVEEITIYQPIDNTTYTVTGYELVPNKEFNEFVGWYFDKLFNAKFTSTPLSSGGSIDLYAKFEETVYTIDYSVGLYVDDETTTDITNEVTLPSTTSFTISKLPLTLEQVTYGNYFFDGWYAGSTKDGAKIDAITEDLLREWIVQYGKYIPLYCEFSSSYTIVFDNNNDVNITIDNLESINSASDINIDDYNDKYLTYDSNSEYSKYFVGWYLDKDGTIPFTSDIVLADYADSTGVVTLYAKWLDKEYVVRYIAKIDGIERTDIFNKIQYYAAKNANIEIMSDNINDYSETYNNVSNGIEYSFISGEWYDGNNTYYDGTSYTFTGASQTLTLYRNYNKCYLVTISTVKATVTMKDTDGTSYNNGSYILVDKEFTISVSYGEDTEQSIAITIDGNDQNYDSSTIYTATGPVNISASSCLVEGTLVTLADGTTKKVEDITSDDYLLVFNHETGKLDVAKVLFNDSESLAEYTIINLKFSNGSIVRVVSEHGFFDLDLNKYVYITATNYRSYIGHKFYGLDGNYTGFEVVLTDAYLTKETVRVYSPVTAYHLNYFTEGLLSMPGGIDGLFNIFEYDNNLQYDLELMKADITKYGLLDYSVFEGLVPYEVYLAFPAKYFNVAIGKGLLTWDDIYYLINRYSIYWT